MYNLAEIKFLLGFQFDCHCNICSCSIQNVMSMGHLLERIWYGEHKVLLLDKPNWITVKLYEIQNDMVYIVLKCLNKDSVWYPLGILMCCTADLPKPFVTQQAEMDQLIKKFKFYLLLCYFSNGCSFSSVLQQTFWKSDIVFFKTW